VQGRRRGAACDPPCWQASRQYSDRRKMFKGFEVQAWFGWIAPIGVPKVDKLTAEVPLPSSSPAFPAKPLQTSPARSAKRWPLLLRRPTSS
jgi:hypothetical protein